MPKYEPHGAQIYNKETCRGFMLNFAPVRLRSAIEVWRQPSAPINPTAEFAPNYSANAMDQPVAGAQSRARLPLV